jgi:benzil reductase ((S)-benzoin forming)
MKNVLIITGGSKGIGSGIVKAYLNADAEVFSISRTVNAEWSAMGVTQIELDLTQADKITDEFRRIFALLHPKEIAKITLINNAGTLGRIGPLDKLDADTLSHTIQLNATVPFICCANFIANTQGWAAKKSIVNITSGAALKPYFGWSAYCSSKAALNMLTQTLALEQAELPNGVKVLAIAPGVVDTNMQTEIRGSAKEDFKDVERFIALKKDGGLNDIVQVGQRIFEMDHNDSLESGAILRVEAN